MKLHETTVKNLLHFLLTILVSSGCTTFTTLSIYILGFLRLYNIYYTFYLHSWFPPTEQNLLHFLLTILVSSGCTTFTTLSTYILGFLRLYKIYYTFYLHSWFPPTVNFFPHCHIFYKLLYLLRLYLRHKNNF